MGERRDVGVRMGIIVQHFYAGARIHTQEALVRLIIVSHKPPKVIVVCFSLQDDK